MNQKWKTREVLVGNIGVGGFNPIRIQSMTTSNTRDVEATVLQIKRLADAGCEIARVTVQGMKEAEACEKIKNILVQQGYSIPIVADIHFFPPAAMLVCEFVDKVRINPGNYVDKRATFKTLEYDDISYAEEVQKIEEKFTPLVEKCKHLKKAMRIGTNHGSLSDRIMNRYGDTPQGMVESALEFARVCRKRDYHNFLFSMKSSNPLVMIQTYRLLVTEMMKLGWDYPLHLGVTEAGEGEDGRVKSAIGIGSLLLDGIGDTIRVSLTEDPWLEIDPCQRLVRFAMRTQNREVFNPPEDLQRKIEFPKQISLHSQGSVVLKVNKEELSSPTFYQDVGCLLENDTPKLAIASADLLLYSTSHSHEKLSILQEIGITTLCSPVSLRDLQEAPPLSAVRIQEEDSAAWTLLMATKPSLIFLNPTKNRLRYARAFFEWLQEKNLSIPVILNFGYTSSQEDLVIHASAEIGSLLCDHLGEGICLEGPYPLSFLRTLSFNILQAARKRIFKTDFISCPSCGRTLFNLQEVTAKIRARTSHLPGVKIAIMGCIVNGPGEMADADFGYVGSKPSKIDLYVGKSCVQKDIDSKEAEDRLVDLIKSHGKWIEPAETCASLL